MAIRITYNNNTIQSIGKTKDLEIMPDDRQQIVKVVGGVAVEDYGVCADGEIISLSAVFDASTYSTLVGYWSNRTLVTVTLDDGTVINNARVVIKSVKYYDELLNRYKTVALEVWRV